MQEYIVYIIISIAVIASVMTTILKLKRKDGGCNCGCSGTTPQCCKGKCNKAQ